MIGQTFKTEKQKELEREGWIQTSATHSHAYYRKDDTAACVSFKAGVPVKYWTVKSWMESAYR